MDPNSNISNKKKQVKNSILVEYEAICNKMVWLPNFRFALIGLYVAGVALMASSERLTEISFCGMIGLSVFLWIIDLRTRGLLSVVSKRGRRIEGCYWNYKWEGKGQKEKDALFLNYLKEMDRKHVKVKFLIFKDLPLPARISHSLGIDLLFLGVIVYSIIQILTSSC